MIFHEKISKMKVWFLMESLSRGGARRKSAPTNRRSSTTQEEEEVNLGQGRETTPAPLKKDGFFCSWPVERRRRRGQECSATRIFRAPPRKTRSTPDVGQLGSICSMFSWLCPTFVHGVDNEKIKKILFLHTDEDAQQRSSSSAQKEQEKPPLLPCLTWLSCTSFTLYSAARCLKTRREEKAAPPKRWKQRHTTGGRRKAAPPTRGDAAFALHPLGGAIHTLCMIFSK